MLSLLAASVIRFISAGLKRTGTILPFAVPFGSFGLPGLRFFWLTTFELLQDCCLDRQHSRRDWRNVKHGYMVSRLMRVYWYRVRC